MSEAGVDKKRLKKVEKMKKKLISIPNNLGAEDGFGREVSVNKFTWLLLEYSERLNKLTWFLIALTAVLALVTIADIFVRIAF